MCFSENYASGNTILFILGLSTSKSKHFSIFTSVISLFHPSHFATRDLLKHFWLFNPHSACRFLTNSFEGRPGQERKRNRRLKKQKQNCVICTNKKGRVKKKELAAQNFQIQRRKGGGRK